MGPLKACLKLGQRLGMYSNNRNSPPDLDELWRQFTQRFSAWFGKKQSKKVQKNIYDRRPPQPSFEPSARHIFYYLAGLSLIAFSLWIGSGFYMVSENETAVLLRWGSYKETISTRGMHWHLPYPIESVEEVDTSSEHIARVESANLVQTFTPSARATTADALGVRATVRYKVQEAAAFLLNNADPEATLAQITQTTLRTLFATRPANSTAPNNLIANPASVALTGNTAALAQALTASVQSQLNLYKTGIQISSITLEGMQLPGVLRGHLEENAKGILAERDRQKNIAQNEAKAQLARTRIALIKIDENAQRYAWRAIAQAKADAERFKRLLPAYKKSPSVVRERLYRETLQEIYSKAPKVWINGAPITGNAGKNWAGPIISLSMQAPSQKTEPSSNTPKNGETIEGQSKNRPISALPTSTMFSTPSVESETRQDIGRNNTQLKESSVLENALFPRTKESLRTRERDA